MKLLYVSILLLLLLPLASALEFDNIKSYNLTEKEVTITNSFLGIPTTKIATAKLLTPLINFVPAGPNELVAEIKINLLKDNYKKALKNLEFYEVNNNNKKIIRNFTYKYKTTKMVKVDDYTDICKDINDKNGTKNTLCNLEITGSHEELKEVWEDLGTLDLQKGEITIGIFTEVKSGDYIEWIPTLFGKEVEEWAVWTSDLNVGLVAYWSMNTNTGGKLADSLGVYNATITDSTNTIVAGLLGNASQTTTPGGVSRYNSTFKPSKTNYTFNMWVYATDFTNVQLSNVGACNVGGGCSSNGCWRTYPTGASLKQNFNSYDSTQRTLSGSIAFNNSAWNMYTIVIYQTNATTYVNGARDGSVATSGFSMNTGRDLYLTERIEGGCGQTGTTAKYDDYGVWNRTLTPAEITDLYNNRTGITYTKIINALSLTTNLISPTNNSNFNTTSITFSANATATNGNVTNMSLYVWNGTTIVGTNTTTNLNSTFNSTTLSRSGLGDGTYLWNFLSCAVNSSSSLCAWASSNRTFMIDTEAPVVNLVYPSRLVTFGAVGQNISLNYSITGSPQSCSYTYDGVNRALNCTGNGTIILSNTKNLTLIANDSTGNTNSTTFYWNYTLFQNNVSYNASVAETSNQGYTFNGTYTSSDWLSVTAEQIYNGSSRSSTLSTDSINRYATSTGVVPILSTGNNYTFYWQFAFTNTSGTTYINTSSNTQLVTKIFFAPCNATINTSVLNFTTYNATNPYARTNSSFNALFTYGINNSLNLRQNISFQNNSMKLSSYAFCVNTASPVSLDADIQYSGTGFAQNYFYYRNLNVVNGTIIQQSLYLLSAGLATLTNLEVVNSLQRGQPNDFIYIYQVDLGNNTERLVAMAKTNYDGKDIAFLNWYETLYRFIIKDSSNRELKNIEPYKIASSTQQFILESSVVDPYDKFHEVVVDLTYNNVTNTFVAIYNDPNEEITAGCLRILRAGFSNATTVSDQCINATSGTLSYVLNQGNGTYYAIFYAKGSRAVLGMIYAFVGEISSQVYNALGNLDASIIAFILIGTCTFIGLFSPTGAVVMLLFGYGAAIFMGLLPNDPTMTSGIIGLAVLGGILAWYTKN